MPFKFCDIPRFEDRPCQEFVCEKCELWRIYQLELKDGKKIAEILIA